MPDSKRFCTLREWELPGRFCELRKKAFNAQTKGKMTITIYNINHFLFYVWNVTSLLFLRQIK
jgi:hypothetical protein